MRGVFCPICPFCSLASRSKRFLVVNIQRSLLLERPTQEPVVRLVVRVPHEFIAITCARPTMYQVVAVQFTSNSASGAFAVRTTIALAERLPELIAVSAQRTVRLTRLLHAFSIALSGETASRRLSDVGVPTSADTRLRLVKRSQLPVVETRHLLLAWMILRCAAGKRMVRLCLIYPRIAPSTCSSNARLKHSLSGWRIILRLNSSAVIVPLTTRVERRKERHKPNRFSIDGMSSKMCARSGSRIVSRSHATLKQRQKDSGVTVRARYKKKRRSSEIAASKAGPFAASSTV